jgi:hypothetical protein
MTTSSKLLTAGDPTHDEMVESLKAGFGAEFDSDDAEVAIYYFACHYHGGQWSNLYSALSTSPYSPGPISTLESEGDMVGMFYQDLEAEFA